MSDDKLTHNDIKELMANPTAETKIRVIEKLSGQYNSKGFTDSQVRLAEQIFRLLLHQAEIDVRRALSENIMASDAIPHDVVSALANDVAEVSMPVLEFSEVLTEDDLKNIIENSEESTDKARVIARRNELSQGVSSALVGTQDEQVVGTLLQNDNAEISDQSFSRVIGQFSNNENIIDSLITSGKAGQNVLEEMSAAVSQALQEKLEDKYKGSFKEIGEIFQQRAKSGKNRVLAIDPLPKEVFDFLEKAEKDGLFAQENYTRSRVYKAMEGLDIMGKLSPLPALSMGCLSLFVMSIARLTGLPYSNVQKLVRDDKGVEALYNQAALPAKMMDAAKAIIRTIIKMDAYAKERGDDTMRAQNNPPLLIKELVKLSKEQSIIGLAPFMEVIRGHIEYQKNN